MKLELCAASLDAIRLAKKYDFDRIELCQNLEQGGMTPSPGMIEYALAMGLETHVLIRPRPGGFFYDDDEIEIMLRDIRESKAIGAHGVVVGVYNEEGWIDRDALEQMKRHADGMEITFHRAFDDLVRFEKGLDKLIELEFNRVLSSGLARNVDLGFDNLVSMREYASGRIEIMCGGGVNASNVARLRNELQPDAIHFSATQKAVIDEDSKFREDVLAVNEKKLVRILQEFGRDVTI
ncbi:MAG: copper homeostasis protein CutC [bacterium]|nr:copper homeostasis protein CutC [bacterium]